MSAGILIITDSEENIKLFQNVLAPYGFNVRFCGEGLDKAIGVFTEISPVLLIVDMSGNEDSALDFIGKVKQTGKSAVIIPIIQVGQRDSVIEAIRQGASDYLVKPLERDRILQAVKDVLKLPD